MLKHAKDISAFCECLYNRAPFDPERIAKEVTNRMTRLNNFGHARTGDTVSVNTAEDFFSLAMPEFFSALIKEGIKRGGPVGYTVALYAVSECWSRNIAVELSKFGRVLPWDQVEVFRHGQPQRFRATEVCRSTPG